VAGQATKGEERTKLPDAAPELAEFAEAAPAASEARPAFREGLREKLWKLVKRQLGSEVDDSNRLG
jgi:hypothetical protein